MTSGDIKPNNTIYINNLNEKIKKDGKSSIVFNFIIYYLIYQ
jgi:hypothetical protein